MAKPKPKKISIPSNKIAIDGSTCPHCKKPSGWTNDRLRHASGIRDLKCENCGKIAVKIMCRPVEPDIPVIEEKARIAPPKPISNNNVSDDNSPANESSHVIIPDAPDETIDPSRTIIPDATDETVGSNLINVKEPELPNNDRDDHIDNIQE